MLFFLKEKIKTNFGVSRLNETIVSRVEAETKAVLYFFFQDREVAPFLVVKVSSDQRYNEELQKEYSNLRDIRNMLPDSLQATVPAAEMDGEWRGLYYYAQRFICGDMLNETIDSKPAASDPARGIQLAWEWLLSFQEATAKGTGMVREFGFNKLLAAYRQAFSPYGNEQLFLDGLKTDLKNQGEKQIRRAACHGDFFPGNIIVSGDRVTVIDWRFMRASYHLCFDFFPLLLTYYTSRDGKTDLEDFEGHFNELFFEKHWTNDFFMGLCREFMSRNNMDKELFLLLLELTLLEWSTREYSISGQAGRLDEIWRRRLNFYVKNKDRIIFQGLG